MAHYKIYSKAGVFYGDFEASTKVEALLQLHRLAGYGQEVVRLDGESLVFDSDASRELCGDVDFWDVVERDYAEESHCTRQG